MTAHRVVAGLQEPAKPALKTIAALRYALLAFLIPAALLGTHVARQHGGDVTGIYHVTGEFFASTSLSLVYAKDELRYGPGPYDSVFTLAFANDPLAQRALEPGHDAQRFYRARRIALSWAGSALGVGRRHWIPYTIPLAQLALLALTVFVLSRLLIAHGRWPGWSLLHVASLGTVVCTLRPLGDLFAANCVVLGMAAWLSHRRATGAVLFAVAMLARESAVLAPLALIAVAIGRRERWWPLAAALLAPLGWSIFLWIGDPAPAWGTVNVGLPFAGILERARSTGAHVGVREQVAFVCTLLALAVCVIARRDAWTPVRIAGAAFALLAILTTNLVWIEFWAYGRVHAFVPALLLLAYARYGRRLDLLGPIASAAAGIAVGSVA